MNAPLPTDRNVALVTGMSPGLGHCLAQAFTAAGYATVGVSREIDAPPAGKPAAACVTYRCDLADRKTVATVLGATAPRVAVLVHNAHHFVRAGYGDTPPAEFEAAWRAACLTAVHATQLVLPHMLAAGSGTLIFTGASASLRGAAGFAAFASAKFALRGMCQSLAREYGPRGIHVAHVILDGLLDVPQTERRFGPADAGRIDPRAVAETYLGLTAQHPSAWTHELDLRPHAERF